MLTLGAEDISQQMPAIVSNDLSLAVEFQGAERIVDDGELPADVFAVGHKGVRA
jgi:hypothetical protein